MAYTSAKDISSIFFDGLDVKQSNNAMTITNEAVMPKRRPFGSAYKGAYPTGQVDGEMTISGWLDSVTVAQLGDLTGDSKVISVLFAGGTVSSRFLGFQAAYVTGAKTGIADDDLDTYEPVITANGCKANFGYVVAPLAARTTDDDTDDAYCTMVETTGASGIAFLHVSAIALDGGTSVLFKIRDSADHITFTDHTAFAAVTAVGAQTVALASEVKKYLSISWEWTGGGGSQSVTAFVGVAID